MGRMWKASGIAVALLALLAAPSTARDIRIPFYGVWMIIKARQAPWIKDYSWSGPESQRLVGKKVIFLWDGIDAPAPIGCDDPRYRTIDVPPEALFQGNLDQPVTQAQMLGFRAGAPITTLVTDCEGFLEFHFVDRSTAMFALDNVIYTIRRR